MTVECKHVKQVRGYWETKYEENWHTGEIEDASIWHSDHQADSFEDLDLHRMQCSQCGKIKYYSGSVRDYYEHGIPSPYVTN